MVKLYRNRYGLKIADIWLPNEDWKNVKADIAYLHGCPVKYLDSNKNMKLQYTLVTDLTVSEDELKDNISKTFKYDIRRSQRDIISCKVFSGINLLNNKTLVNNFQECYKEMYMKKGINAAISNKVIEQYALENAMIMTVAYYDEKPIVFHTYIDGKDKVRLWHSCSNFRMDKELRNVIARANKRLHWEDWLFFKEQGYFIYDWGGIFSINDLDNGIDNFKKSFGGIPTEYYNGEQGISLIGKIALKIKSKL